MTRRRSRHAPAWGVVVGLVLALLASGATPADARPRVAVTAIDGDRRGEVADAVMEAADRAFDVIEPREVDRAADKLGYDELGVREVRKVGRELDADVVLQGVADRDDAGRRLRLKVYFVGSKHKKTITVLFGAHVSDRFVSKLRKALEQVIQDELGDDDGDERVEPPARDDEREPPTEAREPEPSKHHDPIEAEDDEDALPHGMNRTELRLEAGPSVSTRRLRFTGRAFPESPPPYENGAVPGVRVVAELYPFAGRHDGMRRLGLYADYDQTVALNVRTSQAMDIPLPTTQRHWAVDLRYRWVFGRTVQSASLALSGGFAARDFEVDASGLPDGVTLDMPDISYKALAVGAWLRVPVAPTVALHAGGKGLLGLSGGEIDDPSQYGHAQITGVDGSAGVDLVLSPHFALDVAFEAAFFGFSFDGTGAQAKNRDGDETSIDVGGASDLYLGALAALVVAF